MPSETSALFQRKIMHWTATPGLLCTERELILIDQTPGRSYF